MSARQIAGALDACSLRIAASGTGPISVSNAHRSKSTARAPRPVRESCDSSTWVARNATFGAVTFKTVSSLGRVAYANNEPISAPTTKIHQRRRKILR